MWILTLLCVGTTLHACAGPRPAVLVWEGAGAPRVLQLDEAAVSASRQGPGVRAEAWGESPDATLRVLATTEAERPHRHDQHDLTVVLLRGAGVLVVEGRQWQVRSGDVVHVARGKVHHFHPRGPAPVTALVIFTPRLEGGDYQEAVDQ